MAGISKSGVSIPRQPQRQDSLSDQLWTLHEAAVRLGCYDAADWLRAVAFPRLTGEQRHTRPPTREEMFTDG